MDNSDYCGVVLIEMINNVTTDNATGHGNFTLRMFGYPGMTYVKIQSVGDGSKKNRNCLTHILCLETK